MNNLKDLMESNLILEDGTNWSIGQETKWFIYESDFTSSIETGIGYSTFLFAAKSKKHIVCFPVANVEQNVKNYAKKINLSIDNISFVVGKSQDTLPSIKEKVDFALIDGEHMFPCPMIDFYYINVNLQVGGILLIDDMQIPSVRLLYDFLIVSKDWKLKDILDGGRTGVFQKLKHDKWEWWGSQEFNIKLHDPLSKPKKIKFY